MQFIHLADLHIGKKVNEFSMLGDQRYVLKQVLTITQKRKPDGVILAGDIYDKAIPSAEAVQLLDWFLTELSKQKLPVYMVSGNHDSGERLAFAATLLKESRIYVSALYDGTLEPIVLEDKYGKLNLYLLPFVKPVHVRRGLRQQNPQKMVEDTELEQAQSCQQEKVNASSEDIQTYQEAVEAVLKSADIHAGERNVLVAHQLVTGAARCDSEDVSVGGIDNVDASLFKDFDYVALGHIHGPQSMTRDTIRYAGTLLKYSFSECNHLKSITLVEIKEKGNVSIETIPVVPMHDMREIKGNYETLMSRDYYKNNDREDYLKVILTDEEEIPEVMGRLRTVYPNIMKVEYENTRTRRSMGVQIAETDRDKSPMEYFVEFYKMQNNQSMTPEQSRVVEDLVEQIWGDDR